MAIRLSELQYPMLQSFANEQKDYFMAVEDAQKFDQRPFRSMLVQGWIRYRQGRGFHLTREGRQAWYDYHNHNILRKNPSLPLTAYFDPDAYGLRKKVAVMPAAHIRRGAA